MTHKDEIRELLSKGKVLTQKDIKEATGISHGEVVKYLQELEQDMEVQVITEQGEDRKLLGGSMKGYMV